MMPMVIQRSTGLLHCGRLVAAAFLCAALMVTVPARSTTITLSARQRPMVTSRDNCGRDFPREQSGLVNPAARVPKPRIITKAEWGGQESSGSMKQHRPQRITLHHEGSPKPLSPQDDPRRLLRNLQAWGFREKGWADIPYHFLLDLDGNIYAARDPMKVGDTNTTYDPTGHLLVTLMGNYELQMPTQKQLDALCDFLAWLCDYYNIDPATIACHREYALTACPGKYFAAYVLSGYIEAEVRHRIRAAYAVKK
jgi:hypothetical protein